MVYSWKSVLYQRYMASLGHTLHKSLFLTPLKVGPDPCQHYNGKCIVVHQCVPLSAK